MIRFRLVTYALIILLLVSCSSGNRWAERVEWNEFGMDDLPGAPDYPEAEAIVLLDQGTVDVVGDMETGYTQYERHRVVKVLNAAGYRFANISVPYGSRSRVDHIQARTISPEGRISVLKQENIYDVNLYPNFVFYSDQRAKLFTLPAVSDNCILEYRYKILIRDRTLVSAWNFQEFIPSLRSRFTLIVPSAWDLKYRMYGIPLEPHIIAAPSGFKSKYIWETGELPPLQNEFAMPPQRETGAWLSIAPVGISKWQEVSEWYHELSHSRQKAGPEIRQAVTEITKGCISDDEKLKAIFEWVRDRVRYISVSIGIGGFQPHYAEEIFRNQYGDCKDMTTLLCTMAAEAGITVHQVLVSTKQNGIPDTTLASPFHFNHVIAYCPSRGDSGMWMDATEKGTPYGTLPWYDQGLPVLVVNDNGTGALNVTPQAKPDENKSVLRWNVSLGRKGQATVRGTSEFHGAIAGELREELIYARKVERKEWIEQYVRGLCDGSDLDTFSISGLDNITDPLVMEYVFKGGSFAIQHEDRMIIRPSEFFSLNLSDFFRSRKRTNPVRFRFGMKRIFELNLNLPSNWQVYSAELSDSLRSEFGTACWTWKQMDEGLACRIEYTLYGDDIKSDKYDRFREFIETIGKKDTRIILLAKKEVFP